jgi:dGTPase
MIEYNDNSLNDIRAALNRIEKNSLSEKATPSTSGIRRYDEGRLASDYRQNFSVDVDRILHSHAYTRYIDKTQVFYLVKNDHITHRVLHVQLVSKIARTIGRFLGLNQDLIEAIALGHDIGHAPFGHDGEKLLSELCIESGIGYFHHNVQSVQFLDRVERKGKGWNLCLQTLDGILCHNGEVHNRRLKPEFSKTFQLLDADVATLQENAQGEFSPMTLEGCVVGMTDTVSYIGRDIEDAIRLGLIKRDDLPRNCVEHLGSTNGKIVFNLVTDIIRNSYQKEYIAFSPDISEALTQLRAFNLERIYLNPKIKKHKDIIRDLFRILFELYMEDLERSNHDSVIYRQFLDGMSDDYALNSHPAEIVRDFIAGMTDHYFLSRFPEEKRPDYVRM